MISADLADGTERSIRLADRRGRSTGSVGDRVLELLYFVFREPVSLEGESSEPAELGFEAEEFEEEPVAEPDDTFYRKHGFARLGMVEKQIRRQQVG